MKLRTDQFENVAATLVLGLLLSIPVLLPGNGKAATLVPAEIAAGAAPASVGASGLRPTGSLAFVRNDEGGLAKWMKHVYLMQPDGSGRMRVTKDVQGWDVAWSPDGSRIAFTCPLDGNLEICLINSDGSGLLRLTSNSASDQSPTWSPDGLRIAFASDRRGTFQIYVMNATGTGQVALTHTTANETEPAWSPDGDFIAFVSDSAPKANSMFNRDIFIMNADGSGVAGLTTNAPACIRESPAWSPDNRRIAFAADCAELQFQIYIMDADGKYPIRLTMGAGHNRHPAWSADGKQIAFDSARDLVSPDLGLDNGRTQIYSINSDGTGLARLTSDSIEYSGHPAYNWGLDSIESAR